MYTYIFFLVGALMTTLVFAVSPDMSSKRFSWISRAPSRVYTLTKEDLSRKKQDNLGLEDIHIRIMKRAGDLKVHDLTKASTNPGKFISPATVRPGSNDSLDDESAVEGFSSVFEASSSENNVDETGAERPNVSGAVEKEESTEGQVNKSTATGLTKETEPGVSQLKNTVNSAKEKSAYQKKSKSNIVPKSTMIKSEDSRTKLSSSSYATDKKEKLSAATNKVEGPADADPSAGTVSTPVGIPNTQLGNAHGAILPYTEENLTPDCTPSIIRLVDEVVVIGENKFAKEKVTEVGDIDGNGFGDYIVANPSAQEKKGSIRLYLMKENNGFLFSRELVPGSSGFSAPSLKAGDEYGSTVCKLPSANDDVSCVLVVGAPGDNAKGKKKGAVYILLIDKKGSVSKNEKISADTETSLDRQHDHNEGFGSDIRAVANLNGDGGFDLAVKSILGSTTILFLNSKHEMRTGLKIRNGDRAGIMGVVEKYIKTTASQLVATSLDSFRIRAQLPDEFCLFNETACACGLKPSELGSSSCLDVVPEEVNTGRTICSRRDCEASYVCKCDGTKLCKREEETRQVYMAEEDTGTGDVYCSRQTFKRTMNVLQPGAAVPAVDTMESDNLPIFNVTHCKCSPKAALVAPYECIDFLRTYSNIAVICTYRNCEIGVDEYTCDVMGKSYCTRNFITRRHYVNDGNSPFESGTVYCHGISSRIEVVRRIQ